jgi:hypothetical protein
MTLTELEPRWWGEGPRRLGVSFLCPHCGTVRLAIAFANPVDGGPPSAIVTDASMPKFIREHLHTHRTFDVPPGFLWQRTGEDFPTMSLTPSVDASKSGHWHGVIADGVVS